MSQVPPKKKIRFKGCELTVYGIGWLAILCNRGTQSVRRWESDGHLPKPLLDLKSADRRYYTVAELLGYSEIYKRANVRRKVPISETNFKANCLTLCAHLRASMVSNPAVLGKGLPDESLGVVASIQKRKDRIAKEINGMKTGKKNRLTVRLEV